MSTCSVVRGEDLSAFVDDELGIAERREMESHLATCATCAETVRAWRRLGTLFEPFIDEPIVFTPPVRVPQYLRTVLVASVLLLFVIGAVLLGSLGGGTPGQLASPGIPIPSSIEPTPTPSREPAPTPTRTEPAQTVPPIEPSSDVVEAAGSGGPFAATFSFTGPIEADQPIEIEAALHNTADEPVSFDAPVESVFDIVIRDDSGAEVSRRSVTDAWSGDTMTRTVRGGEPLTETFIITAPSVAGSYTVSMELPLEPPAYTTAPSPGPGQQVETFSTDAVPFDVR